MLSEYATNLLIDAWQDMIAADLRPNAAMLYCYIGHLGIPSSVVAFHFELVENWLVNWNALIERMNNNEKN